MPVSPDPAGPVLPYLPPEMIEHILSMVWRFEDQLRCRLVCRHWLQRIGSPVRRTPRLAPLNYYSFTPTAYVTFNAASRPIRMLEFKSFGRCVLTERSPGGSVKRRVEYRPPGRVVETTYMPGREVTRSWDTRSATLNTRVAQVQAPICGIL